jgi:hypothetical protein
MSQQYKDERDRKPGLSGRQRVSARTLRREGQQSLSRPNKRMKKCPPRAKRVVAQEYAWPRFVRGGGKRRSGMALVPAPGKFGQDDFGFWMELHGDAVDDFL